MDSKAQSSLEYLLLIAGVVLVAAIVIMMMLSSVNTQQDSQHFYQNKYGELKHITTT